MSINTGDHPPLRTVPFPTSLIKRNVISAEIDKMLLKGIISKQVSPWAAPVVVVPKPDGSWRFCVSYVGLNAITTKDSYPLHRSDTLPTFFKGKKWFSSVDAQAGFWQCPLAPEDRLKTAFVSHKGQYVFNVLPMGLCNAPSAFQRLMDHTLGDTLYRTTFIFIDDAVTCSTSFSLHLEDLEEVFSKFSDNRVRLKRTKCQFFRAEITYLGHVYSRTGCTPLLTNMQGIRDFATPRKVEHVRAFLGSVGYYRDHINNFALIATPLFRLLKKELKTKFTESWNDSSLEAFNKLKALLVASPVLRYPDVTRPYFITCDSSDFATGAVLSQEFELTPHTGMTVHTVPVNDLDQAKFESGRYVPDSLFSPSYVLNFQVGDHLFHSVDQYVSYRRAKYFMLTELSNRILSLLPSSLYRCTGFQSELQLLQNEVDKEIKKSPHIDPAGWEMYIPAELYIATTAKFYCTPAATVWLLKYPKVPCSVRPSPGATLHDKVLAAVRDRLNTLQTSGDLSATRTVYQKCPIAFYSASLTPAERKYAAREKEVLSILRSVEHWEPYVYKHKLFIDNDHRSLVYLFSGDHTGRLFRWALRLQKFAPFTVMYFPGFLQDAPDGLSRYLNSKYTEKDLNDVLYDGAAGECPPSKEVLQVLHERLKPEWNRVYDPITAFSVTPKLWASLGRIVVDTASRNFYDTTALLPTVDYDVIIAVGPYPDLAATLDIMVSTRKPWALLIPTLSLTHPETNLANYANLQVILVQTYREFVNRNQRSVPVHLAWVTQNLQLPKDLETVSLPNICELPGVNTPAVVNVMVPNNPTEYQMFDNSKAHPRELEASEEENTDPTVLTFSPESITEIMRVNTFLNDLETPSSPPIQHLRMILRSGTERKKVGTPPELPPVVLPSLQKELDDIHRPPLVVPKARAPRAPYTRKALAKWEVESTLDHRANPDGGYEYLVRWKGYGSDLDSWEPQKGLDPYTLQVYWTRVRKSDQMVPKDAVSANLLPALVFPTDPPVSRSKGPPDPLTELRQEREAVLFELAGGPTESRSQKLEDRLIQIDALLRPQDDSSDSDAEENKGDPSTPLFTTSLPLVCPRLGEFRNAQRQCKIYGKYLSAAATIEPPDGFSPPPLSYQVVIRGQFPKKNHLLLFKRAPEGMGLTDKHKKLSASLSPTHYGFPSVKDEAEASTLLIQLLTLANNPLTGPTDPWRFRRKVVHIGKNAPSVHYLELQLTASETDDLASQMLQVCSTRWVTKNMDLTDILPDSALFITALRESTVRVVNKQFPDTLIIRDGVLYYMDQVTRKARIVVPESLKVKMMFLAHDISSSGHPGATATFRALRKSYWWVFMRKEVHYYVSGCLACRKAKATARTRYGYYRTFSPCPVGHTCQIDHFGPFRPATDGSTIILTVVDRASSYLCTYACKDATAETVATALYGHFLQYGFPVIIVSDNGVSFRSSLMHHLCKYIGITHLYTTPYHPQGNGVAERHHRSLKEKLKTYISPDQADWNEQRPRVTYAINVSLPEGRTYSAYTIFWGREPYTPVDIISGLHDIPPELPLPVADMLQYHLDLTTAMNSDLEKKEAQAKRVSDTERLPSPVWEAGQLVLLHREVHASSLSVKFIHQFVGPFSVLRRQSANTYLIDLGNGKSQAWNVTRLYPFHPSSHPRTSHLTCVSLFDINKPLGHDLPDPPALPNLEVKIGQMLLVVVEGNLQVCQVTRCEADDQDQIIDAHLFDTVLLGSESQDPNRWSHAWYPLYLNESFGKLVRKVLQADLGITPVITRIRTQDVLDVPFTLDGTHQLKLAQIRVIDRWMHPVYPEV